MTNNHFLSYLLTKDNIINKNNPIVSEIGAIQDTGGYGGDGVGWMKISPNGKKIALAISLLEGKVELFDFDNKTGKISNVATINGLEYVYGIEFSSDSRKLYFSSNDGIEQLDLSVGTNADAINTRIKIANHVYGSLQLAPNGKIYSTAEFFQPLAYLDIIDNPNGKGMNCNFISHAVLLNPKRAYLGLPNFLVSHFDRSVEFNIQDTCFGNITKLISTNKNHTTYTWNFDDPASGASNTSNLPEPTHQFTQPGKYTVTLTTENGSVSKEITILAGPSVSLGSDKILCEGTSLVLNPDAPNAVYLWQDGSTQRTFTATAPGICWVQVTDACGTGIDTVLITQRPSPHINLGEDKNLCEGSTMLLDVTTPNSTYQWQDNTNLSSITIDNSGLYWVEVTNEFSCSDADSILINYLPSPKVNLGEDKNVCTKEVIILDATTPECTYQWQDNSNNPIYTVSKSGTYKVEVTNTVGCTAEDEITINYVDPPIVNLGIDTLLCEGEELFLNVAIAEGIYQWQDNTTSSTYLINSSGVYSVQVTNKYGCSSNDNITIAYEALPVAQFPEDTVLCLGEIMELKINALEGNFVRWQDGSANNIYTVNNAGNYKAEVTTPHCGKHEYAIQVSYENCPVKIPNVFTPNGDNVNDVFAIENRGYKNLQCSIYNRWGVKVYEWENTKGFWDGHTKGGEQVPEGVYYFTLQLTHYNGLTSQDNGFVQLIR